MVVTYVNNKNQKQKLSGETTAYVLPFSGNINVTDITSPFAYVNGDAIKVENNKITVVIHDKAVELEVDEVHFSICVLCTPWSPTMLLDYNSFGKTFINNLIDDGIDQEILFSAIEDEDAEDLHIPLCTFSRSYENITSREFDIDKALDYTQRIPHVFYKPKQHLKQVSEIRPAAVASRTGQESIRYLASHSEHWKGIKANGLIPERLLARVLEDDYAIYENKAAKTLVDEFLKMASRLRLETMDCQLQINMDDSHSVSSEQKSYFKAKDALLKGLDDDDLYIQQEILAEQTEKLSEIINLLSDCKATQLYRGLRRIVPVRGKLKQTNIFMKDKYYKYVYRLWNLLEGASKVGIEEIAKPIDNEYDIFCRILLLFALRYYNFEAVDEQQDVLLNDKFVESTYRFINWKANVYEAESQGFVLEMSKYNEITVDLGAFEISENFLNNVISGVYFEDGILSANHVLTDKEQEQLVTAAKVCWSKNRQKTRASDMKQQLYAEFFNYSTMSHKILFVPWKYCMPGNVEQIKETLRAVNKEINADEYDECFILTISRPNEIVGVDDAQVMQSMLYYGDANEDKGMSHDNIGVIPISLSDINSYRRYTKILLRHMVALDDARDVCPICGQELYQNGNSFECRNQFCQFELIETKCPECKKEYVFSRYPLSKLAETKRVDSIGFNMLYEENKLAFKNITEAIIDSENDRLVPICPHCGHNTQNE
ncbi:hypothetical protein [Anaerotignum propionicum]|uniref:hypothetical protein n=1 Tax=Anaerotignum propionicum TaxID=28446 RepID=UPI002898FA63|nr:hypothetical protein [Anaerotignum propionicum]